MIVRRLVLPGLVAVAAGSTAAVAFLAEPSTLEVPAACGPRCAGEVNVTSFGVTTIDLDGPVQDPDLRGDLLRWPIGGWSTGRRVREAALVRGRPPRHTWAWRSAGQARSCNRAA